MTTTFRHIILFGSILLSFAACIEPVELELEDTPRLVVISQSFEANEPLQILLARSQPLFAGGNSYVNDAVITLFENGTEKGQLRYETDSEGLYGTNDNFQPRIGSSYNIEVNAPGFTAVTASSNIPEPVRIRDVQVSRLVSSETEQGETELNFKVQVVVDDPAEETNFYHLNFTQSSFEFIVIGNDTIALPFAFGTNATFIANDPEDDFFNHPEGGLVIADQDFNGELKELGFDAKVIFSGESRIIGDLLVELRTVPEEYYLFFNSLQRQSLKTGTTNLTSFDDPTPVFSNIQNGYGIFAGYSTTFESVRVR